MRTDDGCLMGLEDPEAGLFGVQYHTEAILTEHGMEVLANFLRITA